MKFLNNQSFTRTPSVLSSTIDEETVMMSMERGMYYNLNPIGSSIWAMLETPHTFDQIVEKLLDEYDVDRATCESETAEFLESLMERDLVSV